MITLRKDSVISRALADASSNMRHALRDAARAYFDTVRNAADEIRTKHLDIHSDTTKHREATLKTLFLLDASLKDARTIFDRALAEYDLNCQELNAWTTAATAAERLKASGRDNG